MSRPVLGSGIHWWKTRRRCGLVIERVSESTAGDWLCHLAETSSHQEKVKDERLIQVLMASRALIRPWIEVEGGSGVISEAPVGSVVKVSCISGQQKDSRSLLISDSIEKMVQPIPSTVVRLEGRVLPTDGTEVQYNVTRLEVGKFLQFSCHWDQKGPEGGVLFHGQEDSQPIRVTTSPVLESNTSTR